MTLLGAAALFDNEIVSNFKLQRNCNGCDCRYNAEHHQNPIYSRDFKRTYKKPTKMNYNYE